VVGIDDLLTVSGRLESQKKKSTVMAGRASDLISLLSSNEVSSLTREQTQPPAMGLI